MARLRWLYRTRQFATRLCARREAVDWVTARSILPDRAFALFREMPTGDQLHALCVLRTLRSSAAVCADLEQAALLHDVGKAGGGLTLAHRTIIVLLGALRPAWVEALASHNAASWRYPFFIHRHHAGLGAERCAAAGCSLLTVWLVRYHEGLPPGAVEPAWRGALAALQCADDRC